MLMQCRRNVTMMTTTPSSPSLALALTVPLRHDRCEVDEGVRNSILLHLITITLSCTNLTSHTLSL